MKTYYTGLVMAIAMTTLQPADAQDILGFENGYMTFSNTNTDLYHRIEFRPNLTGEEDWSTQLPLSVKSAEAEVSVPVGLVYRVVGSYENTAEVTLVTVAFFLLDEEGNLVPLIDPYTEVHGKIVFDMSDEVYYWSRLADGDMQNPEDGHPHYNAATDMFYIDGVFSWVEYGPEHSQEDIVALVEEGTAGTRKAVTFGTENARFYRDHSGLHLQIESVE